jgi:predicted metalloprotease
MRFNPKARLDTSRMRDSGRGAGGGMGGGLGGGGSRIPLPGGTKAGGGVGFLVIVVVIVLLKACGGVDLTGAIGGSSASGYTTSRFTGDTRLYQGCATGQDANDHPTTCGVVAVENSVNDYWKKTLPQQAPNATWAPEAAIDTFSGQTPSGCGQAQSAMGPFYCPTDQIIYLDTTFFQDVLEGQLGGKGGDFVEPYVIGHEFGHHIQNLMGTMSRVRTQSGPTSDSVRLELQADCYAGMWTHGATGTTDQTGTKIFESIDQADITEALDSAKAVGDDRIQKQGGGDVNKEQWTHGSSEERMRWFTTGYNAKNDIKQCDTFATDNL